ncbi:GntR family transcriptional regulator [Phenylobacterium sp. LjRoot219]|uniref:GntR family transcriptional regulator n=1 Tax=Phenylobacterium sp. LjRoot219 TaxID=3342283 RepID=UPI003ECF6715
MSGLLDKKVQAQSLVDVVAERIEAAIISGALEPGSRLSEQALAASLGVSRGPLREAIRRLEGRKLLQRTPNIGVRVAALSLKDLNELLQVREALEGMAAGLAAKNMTDAEIAALQGLLEKHGQQKSVQEGKGYYQESKDFDFHFRIVTGSRNERLGEMLMGDLYHLLRIYRYKSSTKPGRAQQALQEHEEIVAAIARRDSTAAEAKMREHLRNARLYVEEQLAAPPATPAPAAAKTAPAGRVRSLSGAPKR